MTQKFPHGAPETALKKQRDELQQQLHAREDALHQAEERLRILLASRSWKITAPLRGFGVFARSLVARFLSKSASSLPDATHLLDVSPVPAVSNLKADPSQPFVALFSGMGEGDSPGHIYRIERLAEALRIHYRVGLYNYTDLTPAPQELEHADVLWIWRAPITPELEQLLKAFKEAGKPVIFDIDDMCFHAAHFKARYMDAIRSDNMDEDGLQACGTAMQTTMRYADVCVFTTEPLAHIANTMSGKPCMVIPNSFDRIFHLRAQAARNRVLAAREATTEVNFVRIGYASGTATHQADLRLAAPALAAVLSRHPEARLVLFRASVNIEELDDLKPVCSQIEWRDPVPLKALPDEIARFDISIAPLEVHNPFCNCKSEIKFLEAALAEVPSVLSATVPMRAAVRHGETGFLAEAAEDWEPLLETLVADKTLRQRMGREAYRSVLWTFSPENRSRLACFLVDSLRSSPEANAAAFVATCVAGSQLPLPVDVPDYEVELATGPAHGKVSVVIPLYNYANTIEDALESLRSQTLRDFDVIVVNDASTDDSAAVARRWLEAHKACFTSVALLRNKHNAGLALTRNAGIDYSRSSYVMLLDADNLLLPRCLELCAYALDTTTAAMAYPLTETFGAESRIGPTELWNPLIFRYGNYVDAMAMVRKSHWAALGGYTRYDMGWEDYDFWCKMITYGFWGMRLSEVTARYRIHEASMLRSTTNKDKILSTLSRTMNERYGWMHVKYPVQHGFPPF